MRALPARVHDGHVSSLLSDDEEKYLLSSGGDAKGTDGGKPTSPARKKSDKGGFAQNLLPPNVKKMIDFIKGQVKHLVEQVSYVESKQAPPQDLLWNAAEESTEAVGVLACQVELLKTQIIQTQENLYNLTGGLAVHVCSSSCAAKSLFSGCSNSSSRRQPGLR